MLGLDSGNFERIVPSEKEETKVWKIDKTLTKPSARSPGRDIFVPSAAKIFDGFFPDRKAQPRTEIKQFDWPDDLKSIIYVDHSGYAITGLRAAKVNSQTVVSLREHKYRRARVFSDVAAGEAF